MNTLVKAQARFDQNMADVNAAKAVEDAIDGLQGATFARLVAEKTYANSQRALEESLQQLDTAKQKDMEKVLAQAEQYLAEMKRKRAEINAGQHEQAGGQDGEMGTIPPEPLPPENVSNDGDEGNPLAPVDESVIINTGTQGEDGGGAEDVTTKPCVKNRPKYRLNQVEDVWKAHVDTETGTALDPSGAIIIWDRTKTRNGRWDMGHKPGQKYSDIHYKYMNGEISLVEFLKWYRDPDNYRPELPKTNRSHLYESE